MCPRCGTRLDDQNPVCSRCGPPAGVVAWSVDEDGRAVYFFDPLTVKARWPGISVSSEHFKELPISEQLFARSIAFLQAASNMCEQVGEGKQARNWASASACYYLLHLATELFLKAALSRLGARLKGTHSIDSLLKQYRERLPDAEYRFPVRWLFRPDEIASAHGKGAKGIDSTPDQLFKYGIDKAGTPSEATHIFNPSYFYNSVQDLEKRWQTIWSAMPSAPSGAA